MYRRRNRVDIAKLKIIDLKIIHIDRRLIK